MKAFVSITLSNKRKDEIELTITCSLHCYLLRLLDCLLGFLDLTMIDVSSRSAKAPFESPDFKSSTRLTLKDATPVDSSSRSDFTQSCALY